MAKKAYKTAGRDLYNHRGRYGRLTLVPSSKSQFKYICCDTFGTALRVMEAEFNPDAIRVESEPEVFHERFPTGSMHLDLSETYRHGYSKITEIKDIQFLSRKEVARQKLAKESIEARGDIYELILRDDVLKNAKSKSFQFLYRYLKWNPSNSIIEQVAKICTKENMMRRKEWIRCFSNVGLPAKVMYWATAKGYLSIVDDFGLFPDGLLQGNQ